MNKGRKRDETCSEEEDDEAEDNDKSRGGMEQLGSRATGSFESERIRSGGFVCRREKAWNGDETTWSS